MNLSPLNAARADDVWDALSRHVTPGPQTEIESRQSPGHVIAADVRSPRDFPPFDRATMDGFALRAEDLTGERRHLECDGLIRAGVDSPLVVSAGKCIQINTGAMIPPGADAVVQVEHTSHGDESRGRRPESPAGRPALIRFDETPHAGQNVERRGAILKSGDLLLRAGCRITPGAVAALAAAGSPRIRVFERPRVGVLTTGDEIVVGAEPAAEGRIHDSNSVALAQFVRVAGGEPMLLGRGLDEPDSLREKLQEGLGFHVLLVTGGMSKGSHDLVPAALESLGVKWLVESLHLKPGKPTRIGRAPDGCWVMGLPGNPVSCVVCFLLFGRALLDGLQGLPISKPPHILGELDAAIPANGARPMYHPAQWHFVGRGQCRITPLQWLGSGDPFGMSSANALVYREERAPAADRGESALFVPLDVPA